MELNFKTQGEGPALVILHGLFGSLDNWQTLAKQWAEQYTVISVDLRNHGRSPHVDEMSYPAMAEDLAAFLEGQGVHECYLLGHSMGGKVAMQAALSYPGLVSKLIVIDMAPRQYGRGHDDVFTALHALDPATIGDRREADAMMKPHMRSSAVRMFLLKNLARAQDEGYRWRMNLEVLHRDYETLIGPVEDRGRTFGGPTLFVRGKKSDYVQDEDWPGIQALFSAAQLVTIEGAGHWVHAERPGELSEAVRAFL